MSGPEYDAEFEAYLRRRVRFDRRLHHSLARLEPPEELDRIVIGKAREAIQPTVHVPVFRAPKWAAPLAMAASLLVSLALMLDVGLRQATHHDAMSTPVLMLEMSSPTETDASAQAEMTAAAPAAQIAPEAPRASLARAARQKIPPMKVASAGTPLRRSAAASAAAAEPAPSMAKPAAPEADSYASNRMESRTRTAEPEPARYAGGYAPAPIRLATRPPEMETVVVVGTRVHYNQDVSSAIAVQSYSDFADESRLQPPPIPDLPGSLQGSRTTRPAVPNLAGSANPEAAAERRAHPDPKEWLDHLREIRAAGLNSAADQELKLFRDAYPAYPVP